MGDGEQGKAGRCWETPPRGQPSSEQSPRDGEPELRKQTESPELLQGSQEGGASLSYLHPVKLFKEEQERCGYSWS